MLTGTLSINNVTTPGPRVPSRLSTHIPIKSAPKMTINDTHPVSARIPAIPKFLMRDGNFSVPFLTTFQCLRILSQTNCDCHTLD